MGVQAGNVSQEEINNKEKWVKLTGPAAYSLAEAFLGPEVVVQHKITQEGVEELIAGLNNTPKNEKCIINRAGQVVEQDPQVTRKTFTAEVKSVSVSPTRIIMTGPFGVKKNIKVLKSQRIFLVGNTSTGKSSLGNTIFGEDMFKINQSTICRTSECQAESKSVHGRRITVIDTPSFFDTNRPEEEMKAKMGRCITECAPGPHVILIVLKVEQEQDITKICQYFPDEAFKYAAVVFTHGEQLPEGMKIEEFVEQNECLRDLVKKCSGRCHVVDNENWKNNEQCDYRSNKFQVAELLNTIDKIVIKNKGGFYTDKMLHTVKMKTEKKINLSSEGNIPKDDTNNEPINSVSRNVWLKLTGPAAESLAQDFFGQSVTVLQEEEREIEDKIDKKATTDKEIAEKVKTKRNKAELEDVSKENVHKKAATEQVVEKDKIAKETKQGQIADTGRSQNSGSTLWKNLETSAVAAVAGEGAAAGAGVEGACKELLQQHGGIILLVTVFYSMLLLSFYVQEPVAQTLLLMCGVLLLLLR